MLLSMTPSLTKGKPLGSRPWHQDVATDNDGLLCGPSLVRLVVLVAGPVCGPLVDASDNDILSGPLLTQKDLLDPYLGTRMKSFGFGFGASLSAPTPAGPNSS